MAPKLPPKPIREQARVLFPYVAMNDDELTIKEGDIITIISKENEDVGWWKGELNGRVALFPDNFVEIIKQTSSISSGTNQTSTSTLTANNISSSIANDTKLNRVKKPDRNNQSSNSSTSSLSTSPLSSISNDKQKILSKLKQSLNNDSNNHHHNFVSGHDFNDDQSINSENVLFNSIDSNINANSVMPSSVSNSSLVGTIVTGDSSKLIHLTAQRPKIPSNTRRPPSLNSSRESADCDNHIEIENCSSSKEHESLASNSDEAIDTKSSKSRVSIVSSSNVMMGSNNNQSQQSTISPQNQSEKILPWMLELRKAQESKRERKETITNANNELINTNNNTNTNSSNINSNSNSCNNNNSNNNNNNSSTNISSPSNGINQSSPINSNQYQVNKNDSITSANTNTNINTSTSTNIGSIKSQANHSLPNSTKPFVSKNSKPTNLMQSSSVSDHQQSNESCGGGGGGASGGGNVFKFLNPSTRFANPTANSSNNNSNNIASKTSSHSNSTITSGQIDPISPTIGTMMPVTNIEQKEELRTELDDLRSKFFDLDTKIQAFMKQQTIAMDKLQNSFVELIENDRKSKTVIKELINEWAEEKKKIATIQIELDRLKKLNTTV
ncbi:hypothetical protein NH340_JMT07905 [Sarcoptes scabiei]|nr:hypothetical protein NH340_JMT07905 [Sarcoptes scabiei]